MRSVSAVAMVLALAACGGGGTNDPVASAPPSSVKPTTASPTPTVDKPSIEVVKAALAATRAKGTGTYEIEATTSFGDGYVTMKREGSYDVRAKRAKVTQSFEAKPKELADQVFGKTDPDDLVAVSLAIGGVGYLQMPGWPASIRSKWLRFTAEEQAKLARTTGVTESIQYFPPVLEMLSQAKATNVPRQGATHFVSVPASAAMLAMPGSSALKVLANAGVDVTKIPGTVQVSVDVVDGLVTSVKVDAIEPFRAAWKKAGIDAESAELVTSVETVASFEGHGEAVTIATPPASAVMTDREFENAK